MSTRKLSTMVAAIALDALSDRAEACEAGIKAAFERMANGDATAEREADAWMAKLDGVLAQMGEVEASLHGASKARAEIAQAFAA